MFWRFWTSGTNTTFSSVLYIHTYMFLCTYLCTVTEEGTKHTPEHDSVFMSFIWVHVISIQRINVWHVRVIVWPQRMDQLSFALTRKVCQEKTDDRLCLRPRNECIYWIIPSSNDFYYISLLISFSQMSSCVFLPWIYNMVSETWGETAYFICCHFICYSTQYEEKDRYIDR